MALFRVIIAGTRYFNDYPLLRSYADKVLSQKVKEGYEIVILSGHCNKGADKLGERYAQEKNYPCRLYPALWDKYKMGAGHKRNKQMVEEADALIAFWDGESTGTLSTINYAKEKGIAVRVKLYKK